MKVLLTGGTGVLSTDIASLCVEKGYDTYILNRGNHIKNIDKKINVIKADVRNEEEVKTKVENLKFDVVVDFLSFNTKELDRMLRIFNNKCEQFIFISSATVYKDKKEKAKIEESDELGSVWDYSIEKLECENLLKENYEKNGQKYTIVRPYVTYSKTRIPFGIISKKRQWSLANRILNEKPILIWDKGEAICTLTNSKDFAVGIVGLFNNDKAYGEAFHIASDFTMTWEEAIIKIGQALNKDVKIAKVPTSCIVKNIPELKGPLLGDRTLNRVFDNTKIKEVVPEYNPKITFEEGIKETIQYYLSHPEMKQIDYHWEAQIDYVINKYCKKEKKFDKKELTLKNNKESYNGKDKIIYIIFRYFYSISEKCYMVLKKIKHMLG